MSFDSMMNDPERAKQIREQNFANEMKLAELNGNIHRDVANIGAASNQQIAGMQYGPQGSVDRQIAMQKPMYDAHSNYYNMQANSGKQEMDFNNKLFPGTMALAKEKLSALRFNNFKNLAGIGTTAAAVSTPMNTVQNTNSQIASPQISSISPREENLNNWKPTSYKRLNSLIKLPMAGGPMTEQFINWLSEGE